jgi:uncharacterized protein with HEPN domain
VTARFDLPRLTDIVEAIERIRSVTASTTLEAFERDWQKRWIVERGVEIISEASRRLSSELKARHPEIPWPKVAGIGNILRHEYERIAPAVLWGIAATDFAPLESACRTEISRDRGGSS